MAAPAQTEEVRQYLHSSLESALQFLAKEDYVSALDLLKQAEKDLETLTAEGVKVDSDLVLCVLHNLAVCQQRYALRRFVRLEATASYLDACVFTLHRKGFPLSQRLHREQYECKVRVQLCAMLSQLNRHESAQSHASEAVKLADRVIVETTRACREIVSSAKRGKRADSLSEAALKVLPTLEGLVDRIGLKGTRAQTPARKVELRSVLGVHPFDHWIYRFNIGDLMKVTPASWCSLSESASLAQELSPDAVYLKICLLVVAYFCLAAETRFVAWKEGKPRYCEGELWHRRALTIAKDFLPTESPLQEHIKLSFSRNYSKRAGSRVNGSLPRRKQSWKPLLKTLGSVCKPIGFRSPKGDTAASIVQQILGKAKTKLRSSSAGRPTSGKGIRVLADSSPVVTVSSIPTEESEESTIADLAALQQKRREKKVNVSILTIDEEDSTTVKAVSSPSEDEDTGLMSNALYGEHPRQTRTASCQDIQRKTVF